MLQHGIGMMVLRLNGIEVKDVVRSTPCLDTLLLKQVGSVSLLENQSLPCGRHA